MSSETLKRMSNERQRYDSRGRTRRKNAPPKREREFLSQLVWVLTCLS